MMASDDPVRWANERAESITQRWKELSARYCALEYEAVDLRQRTARLSEYVQHRPTCRRELTRHADDSAAYLTEPCTCGLADILAGWHARATR